MTTPDLSTLNLSTPPLSTLSLSTPPSPSSNPSTPPSLSTIQNIASHVTPPHLPPHRSHSPSNNLKRSSPFQFGSRHLEVGDDVYEFNAWDHVQTDATYNEHAELQYARQRDSPVSDFDKRRFNADPARWWNLFYRHNATNFFKDRKWLRQEFPVLTHVTRAGAGEKVVLEVGAGAGNTAFPILAANENPDLRLWACDFSKKAVELIRANAGFDGRVLRAEVWDVASPTCTLPAGLRPGSVDVVLMIFVFSALEPGQWTQAVRNVWGALKEGGEVCFRDYGRGDLAQVRFKKGRWMGEGWYVRGDGTRVYFFERGELGRIWGGGGGRGVEMDGEEEGGGGRRAENNRGEGEGSRRAEKDEGECEERRGAEKDEGENQESRQAEADGGDERRAEKDGGEREESRQAEADQEENQESRQAEAEGGEGDGNVDGEADVAEGRFEILSLGVDRRLLVNRQRKLKMYRCWMQGRFRKREDAGKALRESGSEDDRGVSAKECSQEDQASSQ